MMISPVPYSREHIRIGKTVIDPDDSPCIIPSADIKHPPRISTQESAILDMEGHIKALIIVVGISEYTVSFKIHQLKSCFRHPFLKPVSFCPKGHFTIPRVIKYLSTDPRIHIIEITKAETAKGIFRYAKGLVYQKYVKGVIFPQIFWYVHPDDIRGKCFTERGIYI